MRTWYGMYASYQIRFIFLNSGHKTGRVKAVNEYIHSFEVTDEFKKRF